MRETPLSNCEREFIKKAVADKRRIDGRQAYDYRHLKVSFGVERGCCQVEVGETRVMSQVSCQVVEPKQARPADGILYINVELSPMACPSFEPGRLSDFGVEINRLLERCLKESRCIDTESLCIVAGEKVWEVRVDVHALNHDGNLIDACSIAAIASLAHFRRPDITVSGDEITIHPASEKDPVPLSVHHMPICVSFAFFEQGKFLLVDPTDKEEKVMDGRMVIGMNKHREICTLQITGQMLLLKDQVLRCSNIAVVKVTEITELIHKALENDRQERSKGGKFGFAESVCKNKLTTNQKTTEPVDMDTVEGEMASAYLQGSDDSDTNSDITSSEDDDSVIIMESGVGGIGMTGKSIGMGGKSAWDVDDEMKELKDEGTKQSTQKSQKSHTTKHADGGDLGDSSEEETTEVLGQTAQKQTTGAHKTKKRKS
ncbi:exosome complex component RRP45-like [Mercenaria mercenaria]|uniref:exosome complex component RRP45-like n=1 Tax=Mercenaria mercenaria TaxID=6596 RepID=UPI00234F1BDD|nr:exosome complex component RRP45-like [Mercenaria mercenaria]